MIPEEERYQYPLHEPTSENGYQPSAATQDEQVTSGLRVTLLPALKLLTSEEQWEVADAQLLQTICGHSIRVELNPRGRSVFILFNSIRNIQKIERRATRSMIGP